MSYEHHHALPAGTHLHEYEIQRTLGGGGFGVAYLAYDHELAQQVVLKEYLPVGFATRLAGNTVVPLSTKVNTDYQWGLERFLDEARALAAFRQQPHIVSVLRYFKANNTAYIVMEYAGEFSLQQFLDETGTLTQEQLLDLVLPLLDALEAIHAKGLIHRDIKPDNILISDTAQPILIDFGSARQAMGERSHTQMFTPGYAPMEQRSVGMPQGSWTDIYGLAAVMYRCVTGNIPMDAHDVSLVVEDTVEGYSPQLLQAIDRGLKMSAAERPQTVAEWREAIVQVELSPPLRPPSPQPPPSWARWALMGVLGLGVVVLGFGVISSPEKPSSGVDVRAGVSQQQASPVTEPVPKPPPVALVPPALDVGSLLATPNELLEKLRVNRGKYQDAYEYLSWVDEQKKNNKLSSKDKQNLMDLKGMSERVISTQHGLFADYQASLKALCPQRAEIAAQTDTTGNNPVLLRHLNTYCRSGAMSYEDFLRDLK